MKKIPLLIAFIISMIASAQTFDTPVNPGDSLFIYRNWSIVGRTQAGPNDSAAKAIIQFYAKTAVPVPPASDSIRVLSVSAKSGTSILTHTVTAPAGSFIVITTGQEGNGKNCTVGGSTAINWVKTLDAQAGSSGDAEVYTSTVAGGTYTITTNWGSTFQTSVVYVITGAEGVGAKVIGTTQGAPSINITTTKANSLLIGVSADYNGRDGGGRVYRDGAIERLYKRADSKGGTNYHYSKQESTIKQYTEGISSPSNMSAGTCFIEVVAKSGPVTPDTEAPTAPALNVTNTTTNSISLSWSASTDNIGVVGYDVYIDDKLTTTVTGTTYTANSLSANTSYSFYVEAKDATGNVSRSNVVSASTQPIPNQVPVARAGNDISITMPVNSATLNGNGSTDADGTIIAYNWSYISGPSQWSISDPSAVSTGLNSLVQGTYVFRLTVTDNAGATGTDDISIIVNPAVIVDTTGIKIEGFGGNAVGGSQSTMIKYVSTKAEFDAALGSNRTILFTKDILFTDRLYITNFSYCTIDGNGFDVTIDNNNNGDGISFDGPNAHHNILKGVRVINSGGDGINVVGGAHDITITNCSAYDNRDGNIDVAGDNAGVTKNVTVQYCFIGRGKENDGSYSGCQLITGQNITSHHNFFSPATVGGVGERNPLAHCNYSPVGNPNADFRNNLVWKWGRGNGTGSGYGSDIAYSATANIIGNYYYSVSSPNDAVVINGSYGSTPKGFAYINGNVSGNGVSFPVGQATAYPFAPVTTQPACDAARRVLSKAGLPKKTKYEQDMFNEAAALPGCPAQ